MKWNRFSFLEVMIVTLFVQYRKKLIYFTVFKLKLELKICVKDEIQNLGLRKIKPLLFGKLVFEKGPEPNKKWGVGKGAVPPSMTSVK